jgi:TPR repeat protein
MKTEISAFSFHNSSFLISSLLLAILYLLGTASFAAANTFDDALAVYERGDYVQAMKLFRQLAETGHQWAQRRVGGCKVV